jgi:hypothetical protein
MHRGGTSAVAGVVHALGAELGPAAHIMKTRVDNPGGFFEHQALTDLNDAILFALGGSWQEPPRLVLGWETDVRLDIFRARARQLLQEDFGSTSLWCWKDPRTCITLPFWRPLLHRPRYVICVRNPIAVAHSLRERDGFPLTKGIDLWMHYMTRALSGTSGSPVLLVGYDDVVDHPAAEIDRLAEYVNPSAPEAARAAARTHLVSNPARRHHQATVADSIASPDATFASSALCQSLASALALQHLDGRLEDHLAPLAAVAEAADRAHLDERLTRQAHAVSGWTAVIADRDSLIGDQRVTIASQQNEIGERVAELRRLYSLIEYLQTPSGAFKVGLRALLPSRAHRRLKEWARRFIPGALRG